MGYRHGFTVVEIAVVITIMAILLVLGIGSYTSSQVNARDHERKTTANNIAQALERFYRSGNTTQSGTTYPSGSYPAADLASNAAFLSSILPGLDRNSYNYSFNTSPASSFLAPLTSDNPPQESVSTNVNNATTTANIVYQPIRWTGSAWAPCTTAASQECRRFKLYYRSEATNTVQTIESRVQ